MRKMKVRVKAEQVYLFGEEVKVGDVIDIPEDSAKRLIERGLAEAVEEEEKASRKRPK